MEKPKSISALRKLLGRECVVEHQYKENNVTGKITGISYTETPKYVITTQIGPYQEYEPVEPVSTDRFVNIWVMINGMPKTYVIDRVKLLEQSKKWWQIWK